MVIKEYKIRELYPDFSETNATIEAYIQPFDDEIKIVSRPAMVIFPGGAYSFTSHREAEPVALEFAAKGYQCFIVWYSVNHIHYPRQLLEAAAAISFVREHAGEFNINPSKVSVIGFSAGGHLAASIGTLYNEPIIAQRLSFTPEQVRPNAMVLCYPVITMGENTNALTCEHLLGDDKTPEKVSKLSLQNRVDENTPPAFIWATANDGGVKCCNSLMMATALNENNVPFELHIYANGPHGMSLANGQVYSSEYDGAGINARVAHWTDDCDKWLRELYALCDGEQ